MSESSTRFLAALERAKNCRFKIVDSSYRQPINREAMILELDIIVEDLEAAKKELGL